MKLWPVFRGLYEHMLQRQNALDVGIHKGMPLVWMEECHAALGHPVLAKRYMMLTAIEDAILHGGRVPTDQGVYFRLVWHPMCTDVAANHSHSHGSKGPPAPGTPLTCGIACADSIACTDSGPRR